jgi:predicted phosphodiesterase
VHLALIADIHGNSVALDAVLEELRDDEIDEYWFLGDLVAIGPDPIGVLDRIEAIHNARCIRGNTDRYVTMRDRPGPSKEQVLADPSVLDVWANVESSFSWTQGAVTVAGRFDLLASLEVETRCSLPDGTRVLGVHASPGRDDGHGAHPSHTDAELAERFGSAGADVVFVGHTHTALDRTVGGVRIVNPGSVSNPPPGITDASYAVLRSDASSHEIELRSVPYDFAAVVAQLERVRHPARGFIAGLLTS